MVKKILYGNDAHNYVGLARHLWKQLSSGKKVYRIGDAYIEICKGDQNYIRIRADKPELTSILLIAVYKWNDVNDFELEFWRVLSAGCIDIIFVPHTNISASISFSDIICGRFNLSNPLEYIVYLKHSELVSKTLVEDYYYYNHPNLEKLLCHKAGITYGEVSRYKLSLDFDRMLADVTKLGSYYYHNETWSYDENPWCRNRNPEDPGHSLYGYYFWQELAHIKKNFSKRVILIQDIYVDDFIKEAYVQMDKTQVWNDIWEDSFNPVGITYGECPPSEENLDPGYKPNPRIRDRVYSCLKYGDYSLILEDTNRIWCLRRYDTGVYVDYDIQRQKDREVKYNIYGVKVLNKNDIYFVSFPGEDAENLTATIVNYGNIGRTHIEYTTSKNCYNGDAYASDSLIFCGYNGQWAICPSISLLRKNKITFCSEIRFIRSFSYMWGAFESESKFRASIIETESGYDQREDFILAFRNPLLQNWNWFGVQVVDDADFGYGGLGWSNPMTHGGPYLIPFTQWRDLNFPKYQRKKGFNSLPNHNYSDIIMIPHVPYAGFFIAPEGIPPSINYALAGSRVFQDMVLLQSKGKKWYINGENLKCIDKERLLGR